MLNDESREEKNRVQRLYNELQDDHDQLYQQYKVDYGHLIDRIRNQRLSSSTNSMLNSSKAKLTGRRNLQDWSSSFNNQLSKRRMSVP
jgi:hypothetical protein